MVISAISEAAEVLLKQVTAVWVWQPHEIRAHRRLQEVGSYRVDFEVAFQDAESAEAAMERWQSRQAEEFENIVTFMAEINDGAVFAMDNSSVRLVDVSGTESSSSNGLLGLGLDFPVFVGVAGAGGVFILGAAVLFVRRNGKPTSKDVGHLPRTRSSSKFNTWNPHFRGPLQNGIKDDDDFDDEDSVSLGGVSIPSRNDSSLPRTVSQISMPGTSQVRMSDGERGDSGSESTFELELKSIDEDSDQGYSLTIMGEAVI